MNFNLKNAILWLLVSLFNLGIMIVNFINSWNDSMSWWVFLFSVGITVVCLFASNNNSKLTKKFEEIDKLGNPLV